MMAESANAVQFILLKFLQWLDDPFQDQIAGFSSLADPVYFFDLKTVDESQATREQLLEACLCCHV
jgi:hypothetical protein